MAPEKRYDCKLSMTPEQAQELRRLAAENSRSMNAEVNARLLATFIAEEIASLPQMEALSYTDQMIVVMALRNILAEREASKPSSAAR
ncbi:hypothetical protein NKI38_14065 [Mesorhizobium sp. M0621]|uniref:hypothetical protein n=1 Tax=Mesorhizobium sp. M0621 TaxID=2956974 RepID=UPI0033376D1A